MYIKMLIFADSLFVESVTVKFRKYGDISVLYLCLLFFVFILLMCNRYMLIRRDPFQSLCGGVYLRYDFKIYARISDFQPGNSS